MSTQRSRRGAVAGVVVGVIVLVLVLGGIWYFVSDPFHHRVNEAINQSTKWTPENIKKDPAGYLGWSLEQTGATKAKLEAVQLSLTKQKLNISDKLEKNSTDKSQGEIFLQELKDKYETAHAKNEWPAKVRQFSFDDERDLKAKIVDVNDYLDRAKELITNYSQAKSRVDDQLFDVDRKLKSVEKLETKLTTDLEAAKAKSDVEGIDGVGDKLDDIIKTSQALTDTDEKNQSMSDMLKPSGEARINDQFDKIMGKKKDAPAEKATPATK